jgi:hypothetical protein
MQILATFYLIEVGLAAAAGLWWFAQHRRTPRALETAP